MFALHSLQVTLHVWFCSPLLPLSPLFSALPAPRYMQDNARWWRRWVNIFIGLVNGQVLLQISLRSGRSCLLVRDSLPSLSPLCVAYHQIPLSGVQASNFLAASSFLYFSIIMSGLAQVEKRSPRNPTSRKLSEESKEITGSNYIQSKYGWCKGCKLLGRRLIARRTFVISLSNISVSNWLSLSGEGWGWISF